MTNGEECLTNPCYFFPICLFFALSLYKDTRISQTAATKIVLNTEAILRWSPQERHFTCSATSSSSSFPPSLFPRFQNMHRYNLIIIVCVHLIKHSCQGFFSVSCKKHNKTMKSTLCRPYNRIISSFFFSF